MADMKKVSCGINQFIKMTTTIELPSKFEKQALEFPESSYGVTRVIVTLDNGKEFSDVFIAWGKEIVKVGSSEIVPFDPSKIVKIRPQAIRPSHKVSF